MTRRRFLPLACAFAAGILLMGGVAWGANPFVDIGGNSHAADIDAIYNAGITLGCTDATHYCPSNAVTRDQMASFLARGLGLGKGHFPVGNVYSQQQAYCAAATANPKVFDLGPCAPSTSVVDDSGASVGFDSSIAIGADGLPVISYYDLVNGDLKVAHCTTAACTAASLGTIDAPNTVGQVTSLAIGRDGLPIISYYDQTNSGLKIAHCLTTECTSASVRFLDEEGDVGNVSSIAIGSDGLAIVAYTDSTNTSLKVARCQDTACTTNSLTTVESAGNTGLLPSIAIGADGLPIIAYLNYVIATNDGDLKVAHCSVVDCTGAATITNVDTTGSVGLWPSIAIGTDGLPIISYDDDTHLDLKVAHCAFVDCTTATLTTVDSDGAFGEYSSIAVGADGMPVISYQDKANFDLRFARCTKLDCTGTAVRSSLDREGNVGYMTSIAIGIDAIPIISYLDSTNADLKVARPPVT